MIIIFEGIMATIGTLIMIVLVIYLSYVCSKFIGRGMLKKSQSRYIKLIDQMMVGQDRSVAIIQTGVSYYLVGIAGSGISILAEIEEEDLIPLYADDNADSGRTADFKGIIKNLSMKRPKR